jgi:hypothetical protein
MPLWGMKIVEIVMRFVIPIGGILLGGAGIWLAYLPLDGANETVPDWTVMLPAGVILVASAAALVLGNTRRARGRWEHHALPDE